MCSAYCVHSLEPAGGRNHWASGALASEDPSQLGWVQDGRLVSLCFHRGRELYYHLGKDAAAWLRTWYSPENTVDH